MKRHYDKRIYLDNAASSPVSSLCLKKYFQILKTASGNPQALHKEGVVAKKIIKESRDNIGRLLGVSGNEIIFTSGGTESDNLAIRGLIEAVLQEGNWKKSKPHIITTTIEHSAILETCRALEIEGKAEVTYVGVEEDGIVDPKNIKKELRPETVMVSVQYANNEIGTIQPIAEIAREIRHYKKLKVESLKLKDKEGMQKTINYQLLTINYPVFHSDAVQAPNYLPMFIPRLGVDLLSISGSKIYGPKGIGALYIRRGLKLMPQVLGGSQEFGLRAGTENTAAIGAFSGALSETLSMADKESQRLIKLRTRLINEIAKNFKEARLNGSSVERLPNNVNISFKNIESDELVIGLDARGIAVSAKSACKSDEEGESHVLESLYKDNKLEYGTIRISLGRETKQEDLARLVKELKEIFKLKNLSRLHS